MKAGYDDLLIYDEPRRLELKYDLAYYGKIDRLPGYQNVETTADRLFTGKVGLHYTNTQRSLGAVDEEQGFAGDLVALVNRADGKAHPAVRGRATTGAPRCRSPTRRSGCAARPAAPTATARTPSRTSSSAASATTTSTTAR